jgi:hypothetical protein
MKKVIVRIMANQASISESKGASTLKFDGVRMTVELQIFEVISAAL